MKKASWSKTKKSFWVLSLCGLAWAAVVSKSLAQTAVDNAAASAGSATVEASSSDKPDLSGMSLENLMGLNVVVTSSAKKAESIKDATSAIYVITAEDIRRSGFQHLADLFKMVPGMQDNQDNASEWSISSRGLDAQYNNKMLVLIDGRAIYGPIRGGVLWRSEDLPLEDIDHIEVIQGPGGTLWGSGAVNGVVNIITKDSKITQGFYGDYSRGTQFSETDGFRYGGKAADDIYYRFYGKTAYHGASQDPGTLGDSHDDWNDERFGFRTDWHGDKDLVTVQGDYQQGHFNYSTSVVNPLIPDKYTDLNTHFDQGGNVLAHWARTFSADSEAQLTAYYSVVHTQTNDGQVSSQNIASAEFQHGFTLAGFNDITWGANFRNLSDNYGTINIYYFPASQSQNTYGVFLQDKLTLLDGLLYLTAGCKLENDFYTGDQYLPSARFLFTPDKKDSFWGAFSKALRYPTRFEESAYQFVGVSSASPATLEALYPNSSLLPEQMEAYEMGYRTELAAQTSLDIAGFFDHYDRMVENIDYFNLVSSPVGSAVIDDEGTFVNLPGGDIWGVEADAKVGITDHLRVMLGYSFQDYDQNLLAATNAVLGVPPAHNLFNGRIYFDPIASLELNTAFYYDGDTVLYDPDPTARGVLASFYRWDLGVTWKPTPNLELGAWGQNLQGIHTETFASDRLGPTNVVPAVYGSVTAKY